MTIGFSSRDYVNTSRLVNALAGLGLLSIGGGLAYGTLKNIKKRFMEATTPDRIQPSKLVQNRTQDRRLTLDTDYLVSSDSQKEAQYLGERYKSYLSKEAGFWSGLMSTFRFTDPATRKPALREFANDAGEVGQEVAQSWLMGTKNISQADIDRYGQQGISFHSLDSVLNNPQSSFLEKGKAMLASKPALRPLWFLPAAVALAIGGYSIGRWGATALDKGLGKNKNYMEYEDKAQKVYNQSAKYLRDVASGQLDDEEDEEKDKKKKLVKESALISGDGSSSFWWNPWILAAVPLSLWTARQVRAFQQGIHSAKEEVADRTYMVRAWQAAKQEREHDYNDLAAELLPEPIADDRNRKIKRKEKRILDSIIPDENNNQLRYENFVFNDLRNDSAAMK